MTIAIQVDDKVVGRLLKFRAAQEGVPPQELIKNSVVAMLESYEDQSWRLRKRLLDMQTP
jgi:hypothetical protein